MLGLLKPYIAPQNERMIRPAEEQWNAIPLQRQRQIWVTLWEQKLRGVAIKDHPYYAIKDCVPMPFNWNGTDAESFRLSAETLKEWQTWDPNLAVLCTGSCGAVEVRIEKGKDESRFTLKPYRYPVR